MTNNNNEALDLLSTITLGIMQSLSNTHTNLIAKVVKVNAKTIDVQPVVAREVNGKSIPLPVFPEVPVINFLGGTSSIQMPIAIGDYCILFISERCIDNWYFGNDNQKPLSNRMFDYSDAVALVGLKNKSGELEIPDRIKMVGDTLQIGDYEHEGNRLQNGDYVQNGNKEQIGDKRQTGNYSLIGNFSVTGVGSGGGTANMNNITLNHENGDYNLVGDINQTGTNTIDGDVIINGQSLWAFMNDHTHSGVQTGGSNTGVPN
jgi:hypothetical protein